MRINLNDYYDDILDILDFPMLDQYRINNIDINNAQFGVYFNVGDFARCLYVISNRDIDIYDLNYCNASELRDISNMLNSIKFRLNRLFEHL